MRKLFWKFGDWIAGLPCHFGFHDYEPWRANVYKYRHGFDWWRNCERCRACDTLPLGSNPPGMQHPGEAPLAFD